MINNYNKINQLTGVNRTWLFEFVYASKGVIVIPPILDAFMELLLLKPLTRSIPCDWVLLIIFFGLPLAFEMKFWLVFRGAAIQLEEGVDAAILQARKLVVFGLIAL